MTEALDGDPDSAPLAPKYMLSETDRAGLRHPLLRTEAGELLSLAGAAMVGTPDNAGYLSFILDPKTGGLKYTSTVYTGDSALQPANAGIDARYHPKDPNAPQKLVEVFEINGTATACYLTSLCLRRNRSRRAGRQFAFLGLIVSTFSAYLGGHLVYKKKLGVDHTADYSPPENFIPVLAEAALPENELKRVNADGMPVLLVRKGQRIHAIAETCAHLGAPLSEGKLEGTSVRCPWHGSRYSLEDGRVLEAPSVHAQPVLEVRIRDGQIEVRKSND